ncbi:uncharacterized protein [Pocillopora verrucosa]|uniref:uncharacterized protein n=1 Tax=Pocillopora verrucosa TaxID=203993 RepID=UPI003341044F
MSAIIRIPVIFLVSLYSVQMHMFRSSYFKVSSKPDPYTEKDFLLTTTVRDELSCASNCNANTHCQSALFDKDSRKCSLIKAKKLLHHHNTDESGATGKIVLEKVFNPAKNKRKSDCYNKGNDITGRHRTTWTSCHDILQRNSSSESGHYYIRTGNVTWKTHCRMKGIPGCGKGVWALAMGLNGSRNTFLYDSHYWTSQASAEKGTEIKTPGYWLSNFTKICITMEFTPLYSQNAAILVNYTEQSLYTALEKGIKMSWHVGHDATSNIPLSIDKSCLIQGFNMLGPHPWNIKSRVGVESQPVHWCNLPYLVRGVGIGYSFRGKSQISCGDVIIRGHFKETHPAFCRIYIQ